MAVTVGTVDMIDTSLFKVRLAWRILMVSDKRMAVEARTAKLFSLGEAAAPIRSNNLLLAVADIGVRDLWNSHLPHRA